MKISTENVLTVKELKEFLSSKDDDLLIVLSKDGEGNEFSPVPNDSFWTIGAYVPDCTWAGEFYCGEDLDGREPNALVLWPTN